MMCQEENAGGVAHRRRPLPFHHSVHKVLSRHARKKMEAVVSEVFRAINSHNRNRWWNRLAREETSVHAAHPNIWRDSGLTHEGMRLARRQRDALAQPPVLTLPRGDQQFQEPERQGSGLPGRSPGSSRPARGGWPPRSSRWPQAPAESPRRRLRAARKHNSGEVPALPERPLTKLGFAFYLQLPPVAAEGREKLQHKETSVEVVWDGRGGTAGSCLPCGPSWPDDLGKGSAPGDRVSRTQSPWSQIDAIHIHVSWLAKNVLQTGPWCHGTHPIDACLFSMDGVLRVSRRYEVVLCGSVWGPRQALSTFCFHRLIGLVTSCTQRGLTSVLKAVFQRTRIPFHSYSVGQKDRVCHVPKTWREGFQCSAAEWPGWEILGVLQALLTAQACCAHRPSSPADHPCSLQTCQAHRHLVVPHFLQPECPEFWSEMRGTLIPP